MLPVESAERNELIADVSKMPSMPRFNTPERSVNSAPSAAKTNVVAMATESPDMRIQMLSFMSPPELARFGCDTGGMPHRRGQRARLRPAT
jgi:hypothetical protein